MSFARAGRGLPAYAAAMLAAGLCACSQTNDDALAPAASTAGNLGERLYQQNCVPCHGENGQGVPNVYPSLAHSPVADGDPAQLVRWVLGGQRPPSMAEGRYATRMLQFGWMKDPDAAALLSYVRSHFGNAAPPVDAAAVAAARP